MPKIECGSKTLQLLEERDNLLICQCTECLQKVVINKIFLSKKELACLNLAL